LKVRLAAVCFIFMFFLWSCPEKAAASPWAEKEGYGAKTGGKLVFGLKHTLFSWMNPWAESHDPVYETHWTGFCAGIGKSVIYTAAGAIQLVTFPIPVDFPNVGLGMHIPANHIGVVAKGQKKEGDSIPAETADAVPAVATETLKAVKEPSAPETKPAPNTVKKAAPNILGDSQNKPTQSTASAQKSVPVIK